MAIQDSLKRKIHVLTCPQCGAQIPDGSTTNCAYCGARLVIDQKAPAQEAGQVKYCKFCGKQIPADAVVCTGCGRQVEQLRAVQTPVPQPTASRPYVVRQTVNLQAARPDLFRDKWVALLLCFFLGIFGVHKFYEKKYLMGILYLFTFGLLTFGVIADLIILLFKPRYYIP